MFISQPIFYSLEPFIFAVNASSSKEVQQYLAANDNHEYAIQLSRYITVNHRKQTIFAFCIIKRNSIKKLGIFRVKDKTCRALIISDCFTMVKQFIVSARTLIA